MGISNLDEDELETSQADGSEKQSITQDEPHTDRESLRTDAFAEGIEDNVIEELAAKEEVTLDDLRKIPGAEGLTDSQLQAAWDKAQAEAGGQAGAEQKVELPFPVYDAQGNKIAPDKVTLGDLLSGKALVGYNAMGKEQRKALSDVIRNASQGHFNEHRYNTVQSQYREAATKLEKLNADAKEWETQRSQWTAALNALAFGDTSKMAAIVNAYKAALGKSGQPAPEGFIPQEQAQQEREAAESGMRWWADEGLPAAYDIASTYGADKKEVAGAVQFYINQEGSNMTRERLQEIYQYDVPMLLEEKGYKANGQSGIRTGGQPTNTGPSNDVADLRRQLEAQAAKIAELSNGRTQSVRDKGKKAPSAGSGSTPGASDGMPSFKSRQQMKDWLQGSDE